MPRSKRNKVITLSKKKKKTDEAKNALIDEVRECTGKYSRLYLLNIENERTAYLQEVRKRLRPSRLVCAKNKQMQVALGTTPETECQDGIHKLAERLTGPCCLLFSDMAPADVQSFLADFHPCDFARCGSTATETVVLPRGQEALAHLPHSIEAHLRQLGMPTRLLEGKIHLLGDHTVCTEGKALTSDQAQVLQLLGIKQARFSMDVECHWAKKDGTFVDCNDLED